MKRILNWLYSWESTFSARLKFGRTIIARWRFTRIEGNTVEGFAYSITTDQTSTTNGAYGYTSVIGNYVTRRITRDTSKPATGVVDDFNWEFYVSRSNYDLHGLEEKTVVKI